MTPDFKALETPKSYKRIWMPEHPNAAKNGMVPEHVVIASKALGKPIPETAPIHHVDGNKRNNANNNLVICEDETYHRLLHFRWRILKAGGDPDKDRVCTICRKAKPISSFYKRANKMGGSHHQCHECAVEFWRAWNKRKKSERTNQ